MTGNNDREIASFVGRMAKRLKDDPGASLSGKHRAAFNAARPLVEGALASGYTVKATWMCLHEEGKLAMTYETFRAYCRQAGLGRRSRRADQPRPSADAHRDGRAPAATHLTEPQVAGSDRSLGFRHERVPRKKEIYG